MRELVERGHGQIRAIADRKPLLALWETAKPIKHSKRLPPSDCDTAGKSELEADIQIGTISVQSKKCNKAGFFTVRSKRCFAAARLWIKTVNTA